MNEKIEKTLRSGMYWLEDAGDGVFVVMGYEPSREEQKQIYEAAICFYGDVQWCPDPSSHGENAAAVLNCFYPVHR